MDSTKWSMEFYKFTTIDVAITFYGSLIVLSYLKYLELFSTK